MATGNRIRFADIKPSPSIYFWAEGVEVARLSWHDGVLRFEGNMDAAARQFLDYLKPLIDAHIRGTRIDDASG